MHDLVAGWRAGAEEKSAETAMDTYKIEDIMIIPIIHREKSDASFTQDSCRLTE